MTQLNDQQRQLLLDHSLGMTSERETDEAQRLLATNAEAAQLGEIFRSALSPLESVPPEPCPEELAERTVLRLKQQAQADAGSGKLQQLLEAELSEPRRIRVPLWRNWSEVVVAAAAVALFVSLILPALGLTRQKYWQMRCGSQLAGIYNGLAGYVSDHDGMLPAVTLTPGGPWWKIGNPGQEDVSNTRRGWLLVRQRYVQPGRFICSARRVTRQPDLSALQIEQYNDFPNRRYIHFSIRISCPDARERCAEVRRVIMADLNPLSEMLPEDHSSTVNIELSEILLTSNSRNHNSRGQNVLYSDGTVEWTKRRTQRGSDDDFYTVQAMSCGQFVRGCEVPDCEKDTFLAP